jgi:hypothetical protein
MKNFNYKVFLLMSMIALFVQSCMDDTPPGKDTDPILDKEETRIMPASPTTVDEVKVVTHDCKYYVLASVTDRGKDITIKRRFNSQMKQPCVLAFDTISLGKLKQGNYSVILMIVDTNPMVTDSIFSKETLELTVAK